MYSLIILIAFKILNTLPQIDTNLTVKTISDVFWYSLNFSLAVYFIHISFIASFNNSSSIRILRYSRNSDSYFLKLVIISMFLFPTIPGVLSIYQRINSDSFNLNFGEIVLSIMNLINILIVIGLIFIRNKDRFDIIKQTRKHKNNAVSILILIVSIIVIIAAISSIIMLDSVDKSDRLNLLIIASLSFSILVITEKIIERYKYDIFAKDLENLEYEIYVKDLKNEEIRDILQKKYMGFLINDYLDIKRREFENKQELFQEKTNDIFDEEKELKTINLEKYPLEYKGRREKMDSLKSELDNEKMNFYKENIQELREIIKKDPNISSSEYNKIDSLVNTYFSKVKEVK